LFLLFFGGLNSEMCFCFIGTPRKLIKEEEQEEEEEVEDGFVFVV